MAVEYTFINLTDFLYIQKFLKFDYIFALTKYSDDNKVLKIPIKEATNFTKPKVIVKDKPMAQKAIKNPDRVPYPLVGVILKQNVGLNIMNKKLIVIDIDCKTNPKRGKEVFDDVVCYLSEALGIDKEVILSLSEQTISGGYHIFLTSNNVYAQKKLYVEPGIEIEIFSTNRYIATAPSKGYTPLNSHLNCVELTECTKLHMSVLDLDHFCSKFSSSKDSSNDHNEINIKEDFIFDNGGYKKITKDWEEFSTFIEGKSDWDWDNISEKSSYDYIRFNIMPIMTLFNKQEEFLESISQFGDRYVAQWKNYPKKWQEQFDNGDIVIGSDAKKRLGKVGALEKTNKERNTKQDLIDEFVTQHMTSLFEYVLVVHGAIYYYDIFYKCYVYLEAEVFNITLGSYYKNKLNKTLKPEDFKTIKDTFDIYSRIFANDDNYETYMAYDILRDKSYLETIPIVFRNGTLYIKPDCTFTFNKDRFDPYDRSLFSIQVDFKPELVKYKEDSIIADWFNTKFDKTSLNFIKMFFGNLLVPSYNPSIMLALYSYKGAMGKSTLAKALSSLFDIGSNSLITAFPLSALDDKFGGGSLSRSLLNITTELDGRIDSEAFKNVISRERWRVEAKFENAKYEIPLAKHIAFSNDMPKISADGGVTRRLAVFSLNEQIAKEDIEPHVYEKMFLDDRESLVGFMLQGLFNLMKLKFCDMSNYYRIHYKNNIKQVQEFNSNVYEWLGVEGMNMIEKTSNVKKDETLGIKKESLYSFYKTWCQQEELNPVKQRTFLKYLMTQENVKEARVRQTDGSRPRVIVLKKVESE